MLTEKSLQTKQRIQAAATDLIQRGEGDLSQVTMRAIARQAGVSVGLINHYFASKDQLVETCVQQIIRGVVTSFQPTLPAGATRAAALGATAKQVADFLFAHPQISRISILGDLQTPGRADNTAGTVQGFAAVLAGGKPGSEQLAAAFALTSVLQTAFLRRTLLLQTTGLDLSHKPVRDGWIDSLVATMTRGT